MTAATTALIILVGLLIVVVLWVVGVYNGLIRLRNLVQEAWRQIDVELQRRHNLIPNLVETVKGYAAHEKGTFEEVTRARNMAVAPGSSVAEQAQQENVLTQALGRLIAVAEAYPDLKANQNFLDLQNQLEGTENRINVARQRYNKAVQTFNSSIRTFPNNLTNKFLLKLERKEPFQAEAGAETAPKVKF